MADTVPAPAGRFLLHETEDGEVRVDVRFEADTLWLTQAQMAALFDTTPQNVTQHLAAIYASGELDPVPTCKDFLQVRQEGGREVRRRTKHYNLEAILAVGYRVRSPRGTQFRRWATAVLAEYALKGFALDDRRLKNPPAAGGIDHFAELLARIRDIRASEKRMYLRVRELFALAADYSANQPETRAFFQKIQNKLHFAVTGQTAPELIRRRAQATLPNMGLTTWEGDRVRKTDVKVAKNYLREPEIQELNRIVTMWLDFAEDQTTRKKQVFLRDWSTKLDEFLRFNDRQVLPDAGLVSREAADLHAEAEYEAFAAEQRRALEDAGAEDALRTLESAAHEAERARPVVRSKGPKSKPS